ncbi:MAG: peptidase MA family metallohydrolase [Dehalococcoidales bacterium]|nr:peptidase MA family metallohydrolase [Dehalococcoidales bacterium]
MKRIIGILIVALCVASLSFFPVQGQEGVILLKSRNVSSQFPDGVAFTAVAETVAPERIQEIKLEMRIKGSSRGSYAYLEFTPDTTVQGTYLLRTNGAQYKPPGIMIDYRFIITDSKGRTQQTPEDTFLHMDNRFEWENISEGLVEVYYYGNSKDRAESVLAASTDTVTRMGALFGVEPSQTIRIIAYNNYSEMELALPFMSETTETELMLPGVAFYEYNVLLELSGYQRAGDVANHEITHMLVREATKDAYIDLPAWLDEGLAEYAMGNPDPSHESALSEGIAKNQILQLRHMQALPGKSGEILLFYGQAHSIVTYLIDSYDTGKIQQLFAAFIQGLSIDEALISVYGFDQDGLDNAWRESMGLPLLETEQLATSEPTQEVPGTTNGNKWWELSCAPPVNR